MTEGMENQVHPDIGFIRQAALVAMRMITDYRGPEQMGPTELAQQSFEYADAMYKEAAKRYYATSPENTSRRTECEERRT